VQKEGRKEGGKVSLTDCVELGCFGRVYTPLKTKDPRVRFVAWCLGAPVEVKISTEDVGSGLDACLDKMSVRLLITTWGRGGESLIDASMRVFYNRGFRNRR
jgi:hypothetical protein